MTQKLSPSPKAEPAGRGRPKGQTKAAGHPVSPGRPPVARPENYLARLSAWRAWWPNRPARFTAAALAQALGKSPSQVSRWAKGTNPPAAVLDQLEQLCTPEGYQPHTVEPSVGDAATSLLVQEGSDFTAKDKEWIDKIDGTQLTLSDIS